jgi:hypothetical protein
MRFAPAILVAVLLLSANATGIMYLTSGSDSYGKGLSYPGYKSPPAIASFVASDHTSRLAPVFLGATLYRPEFANISSINRSYYDQFLDTRWHYHSPSANYPDWSALGMERDIHVPAVREFIQPSWKPGDVSYQEPGLQEFMQGDWETPELSKEDYPGINEFLKYGEDAPGRPLL